MSEIENSNVESVINNSTNNALLSLRNAQLYINTAIVDIKISYPNVEEMTRDNVIDILKKY